MHQRRLHRPLIAAPSTRPRSRPQTTNQEALNMTLDRSRVVTPVLASLVLLLSSLAGCGVDNLDSKADPICVDDQCTPGPSNTPSCVSSDDCPAGMSCLNGSCQPIAQTPCWTDQDCDPGAGSVCDKTWFVCVQGCQVDSDCSAGEFCNTYYRSCALPCPADNHCPGFTVCSASREPPNLTAFMCWACISVPWPCITDVDCADNQVCTAGRCNTPHALPAQPPLRFRAPPRAPSLVR
jgi:Cys-rich repeat protein